MNSKSQKSIKKTCQHIFTLGERKGKKCGKGCRDDYCNNHKKSKKEYKAKWFQEQQRKNKEVANDDIISRIYDCKNIDNLPSIYKLDAKIHNCKYHFCYYNKKLIGYKIKNNINQDKQIEELKIRSLGECICTEYIPTPSEIDKYRNKLISKIDNDTDVTIYIKPNKKKSDDKIIEDILRKKRCLVCDKYAKGCKYCTSEHIEYFPTNLNITETRIEKLEKKIEKIKDKYKINIRMLHAVKEMQIKLS